jgi:hypothetical protein
MTVLATNGGWHDWYPTTTGDGSLSSLGFDNMVTTATAGTSGNRAYYSRNIPAYPGETIVLSVVATKLSGLPQMIIDYPATASPVSTVYIDKEDMARYELRFTVPYTSDTKTNYIKASIGVFSADAGSVTMTLPTISVENSTTGFARNHCMGLIKLNKSSGTVTASLNSGFVNSGIRLLSYSSGTGILTVYVGKLADEDLSPIFNVGLSSDRLLDVSPRAGAYDAVQGTIEIKFSDGTNFVDITPLYPDNSSAFLWISSFGL